MILKRRNIVGIPLKSKQVAKDWSVVCRNLQTTIDSVLRQDAANVECVIAGHEKPEFLSDPAYRNVHFISVDFEPPSDPSQYMADKAAKKKAIGVYLRKHCWRSFNFMFADADDILHPSLIRKVRPRGRYANFLVNGLLLDAGSGKVGLIKGGRLFYRHCGTSMICRMRRVDLPRSPYDKCFFTALENHTLWPEVCEKYGVKVNLSEFIGVAYLIGHVDNDRALRGKADYLQKLLHRSLAKPSVYADFPQLNVRH